MPHVVADLATASVLVESFEEGRSVSHYIRNPSAINTQIVGLGVDAYLKMLLKDNFVHTDLHPGNIMVRQVKAGAPKTALFAVFVLLTAMPKQWRWYAESLDNFMHRIDAFPEVLCISPT